MNGQQLKALIEPAAAAAEAVTAAAAAPGLANNTTAAQNAGTQPGTQSGPSTLTPEQGASAPAPPTATTAVSEAAQEEAQQQQQRGTEADGGVTDMDMDVEPRSPFAAVKLEPVSGVIATAPGPLRGLKSEPSLQFWAGNTRPHDPPEVSQPAPASGAAASETPADRGTELPAPSSQPPPPPGGAPDLAAAAPPDQAAHQPGSAPAHAPDLAAAAVPDLAAQQQPNLAPESVPHLATPAGSSGHAEGTAVHGSQSAPPASQEKPLFNPEQAIKDYSRNAGVLFAWSTPEGGASAGPHAMQRSSVDACQPGSTAANSAQPVKLETDDVCAVGK